MDKIKTFLLPYSGASKYSYAAYVKSAPSFLEMIPIEIPGRGARAGEEPLTNIHKIVDDVFKQVKKDLWSPYAIYGHSLGSLLGYLLTHKILQAGLSAPLHLFFTGCVAPSLRYRGLVDHLLPRDKFIERIKELEGSPNDILNNQELMDFFLPILRADFQAASEFQYENKPPFDVDMTILIGSDDEASYEEALAWQKETRKKIEVKTLPGNHFFIFDHTQEIMEMLAKKINLKLPVS